MNLLREYKKCADLLAELIDLDTETKGKINQCFQVMGIKNFFLSLEIMGLSPETTEKLKSIRSIIEMLNEEREQA